MPGSRLRPGAWPVDLLAAGAAILVTALLAAVSLALSLGWVHVGGQVLRKFDVASEANVWTWANVIILATGAYTHLAAAWARWRLRRRRWPILIATAACLGGLSLDDLAGFHEQMGDGGTGLGGHGFLKFSWVIPGSPVALAMIVLFAVAAAMVRGRAASLLIAGVLIFFIGALGAEAFSGWVLDREGHHLHYILAFHVEEMLEAVGAALMLAAGLADLPPEWRRLGAYGR